MGSLSRSFAANHFEAAGEVKGEARIGGKRIPIDGLCYRDHRWGVRDWSAALLTHRWFTGTFGPALSFGLTTWHAADGVMSSFAIGRASGRERGGPYVSILEVGVSFKKKIKHE